MNNALDNLSDEELLRRMLAGDGVAFARLYQLWQSSIYRFSLRMSGSEASAEDVTQEVFLTLMENGHQYSGKGTFASYLFSITRHKLLRRFQRERLFTSLEAEEDFDNAAEQRLDEKFFALSDPLVELTRNEMIETVRQAVMGLPLHYREVVLLCHLHELSYAEAAEVIGCEIGTVCSRLYRARAILATRLERLKADAAPQMKLNLARCSI